MNKFTVAPRSAAALVPPPSSLQIQILCDQKMRQFLPALRHRPLFKIAPCECALNKFGLHFRHCHQRTKHCQCLQRKTSWRIPLQPPPTCHRPETDHLSPRQSRPPALIIITFKLRDTLLRNPRHCVKSSICSTVRCRSSWLSSRGSSSWSNCPKLQSVIAVPTSISKLTALKHNVQKQSVTADLGTNDSSFNTTSCTS